MLKPKSEVSDLPQKVPRSFSDKLFWAFLNGGILVFACVEALSILLTIIFVIVLLFSYVTGG